MNYLIINTKLYDETSGEHLFELLEACKKLQEEASHKNVELIIAPETLDLSKTVKEITTFSQHVDSVSPGGYTGYVSPHHVAEIGAKGTLLNHSEHQISFEILSKTVPLCREVGLKICVCARTPEEIEKIRELKPDFVAFEPEELIGGDVSVSSKQPQSIEKAKQYAKEIPLLVGAGVKTTQDVSKAIELGASGILVASGVDKAQDKFSAIKELLDGF